MSSKYHTRKDGKKVRKGLWYNINKKKKAGTSRPGKGTVSDEAIKRSQAKSGAWTRSEGKNPSGGLKGRKSYERENPGSDLKAPQPGGGSRKKSFCARMCGMKKRLTSSKTANDPNSRINKALRKWKCKCGKKKKK
jgi:hypothetical protein